MKVITQEQVKRYFEYRSGVLYWKELPSKRTKTAEVGKAAGHPTSHGYMAIYILRQTYQAHRLIYLMHHGYMPASIDHIDGNRLNNCIENLRHATHTQNMQNSKLRTINTSGLKGVSRHRGKWAANISVNGQSKFLGVFDHPEIAGHEYNKAAVKHHGEFAVLNPVGGMFV